MSKSSFDDLGNWDNPLTSFWREKSADVAISCLWINLAKTLSITVLVTYLLYIVLSIDLEIFERYSYQDVINRITEGKINKAFGVGDNTLFHHEGKMNGMNQWMESETWV